MNFHYDPTRIRRHRSFLHAVDHWIDSTTYAASRSGYGCPARLYPMLDLPLNEDPTYTDLIAEAAGWLPAPVRYLEIGVSVGKNFWVLANVLEHAELVGFDWEKISPALATRFTRRSERPPVTEYTFGTNRIAYIEGNVLSTVDWQLLGGQSFNLVFSDAIHQTAALLHEFAMLDSLALLDARGFCMFWDDLDVDPAGPVSAAYFDIARQLKRHYGASHLALAQQRVNGWLGQHEHSHLIGMIAYTP